MPLKSEEEILRANSVNLPEFLMSQGENLVRSGRGYRMKEHNSLFIQEDKWYWNSRSKGGNPVKFVMEYYNKTFPQAVDMLNGNSYVRAVSHRTEVKPPTQLVRQKKEIHIEESEDCKRALAYLSRTRGLDYNMVLDLVKQGKITQDKKNNAVFRITDENNMTVGAELVGTATDYRYKGIATGSAYGYGFEICKGKGENALFFESSIDMLSYMQIYNDELDNHRLVSMIGVKPGTVEDTMKRYNIPPEKVYLCVDNDTAGDVFANKLKQKYPEMHRISTIAPYKDWNEQLKKGIFEKKLDFNALAWYNKGEDTMNITDVRNDYTSSIRQITSSSEEWEKFLRFSAHLNISENQQKHGFSSKLLIYSENPNTTECKTFAEWKSENNTVKFGSRGIPVLTDTEKGEPVVTHVFDVSQTVNPPERSDRHITAENENAVLEALINTYGYSDMYIESVISTIVNDEVQTANLSDEKKAMLSQSICFQLFERFGLNMEYDYGMFENITNMSIMDVAEIGCAMNKIVAPLENLIESTIRLESERSSEHERLHQQGRNGIYMERGSTAALPDVSTGEQPLVQTGQGNLDIYPDDEEYSYSSGGNGQVWFDENEIFGEPQDSFMADVDLGEQAVRPLHRSERGSSESDRPDNGTEDENRGIYGSSEELSSDSTAQESVPDGSGRTDTSRTDIRIDENNIEKTAESEKASVVFSCYEKLKEAVLSDSRIINAIENSDRENLNIELEKVIAEKGIEVFNENIYGNIDFYADFASSVKTENRINAENEITSAIDNIIKSRSSEITVNETEHTDNSEQLEALKSAALDENGKIIKIISANPDESFLNQVVTDYIDDIAADMYTKAPENSFLNDFFGNKDFHDEIINQIFTEAKERAKEQSKNAEQNTEHDDTKRSTTENKIFGNTPFRFIPKKTYTKVSADIVEDVAAQLEEQGLKYSGVIKGDTATFTTSKFAKKNIDEIISNLTATNENTDKEELHRYYSTHREDGAFPDNDSRINSAVFEEKQYIEEIDRNAYGYAEYSKPLTETEINDFDLTSETDRSLIQIAAVKDDSELFTEEKNIDEIPEKPVDSKYDSMFEALDSGAFLSVSEPKQSTDPVEAMINNAKQPEFENMKLSHDETGYVLTADLKGLNSADNSVVLSAFGEDKSAVAEYIENHNFTVEDKQRTAEDISIGDKYLYRGTEFTVTSLMGVYPNDVGISEYAGDFEITQNIDKYKLHRDGEYLGKDEKKAPVPEKAEEKAPEQKKKFKNTLEHRNYKKMESLFPEIMNGEQSYQRFEGSYEPLSVEKIGKDTVSIMQTYIQNGDVMRDPDIVVSIDNENQTVKPFSYEQSGLAMYIEYNEGSKQQRDCSRLLNDWLNSIENMDLDLVKAVVVHEFENKEHDICISYKNGKVADIQGDERAIADYMQKNGITLETEPTTEAENSYIEDISDFNSFEQEEQLSFETELSNMVREKNIEAVQNIEVGDEITLNDTVYIIDSINDDFMMSMTPKNTSNEQLELYGKSFVGNWREQLVEEAENNPIFVIKPDVAEAFEKNVQEISNNELLTEVREKVSEYYNKFYNNGIDKEKDYAVAIAVGDEFIERNPSFVAEFNKLTNDIISSDREVAAFAYALADCGVIDRFDEQNVSEKISAQNINTEQFQHSYEIRISRAENIADQVATHIADTGAAYNNDFVYATYPDYRSASQALSDLRKELEHNEELNAELFNKCPYYEREISKHMEITLDGEKYSVFDVDRLANTVDLIKADDENVSMPYIMAKNNPDIAIRTEKYDYIDSLVNEQSANAINRENTLENNSDERITEGKQMALFDINDKPYQVITFSHDMGADDKLEYATLKEAIQAGENYLADGYEQYAVFNNETKIIEHATDMFPSEDVFSENVLKINGIDKDRFGVPLSERNENAEELTEPTAAFNLRTYHGTTAEPFDVFKYDYRGAIWTTPDFECAKRFAGNLEDSKVLVCDVKLENPAHIAVGCSENWDIDKTVFDSRAKGHDGAVIDFVFSSYDNSFYDFTLKKYPDEPAKEILANITDTMGISSYIPDNETIAEFDKRMKENNGVVFSYVSVFDNSKIEIADRINVYEKTHETEIPEQSAENNITEAVESSENNEKPTEKAEKPVEETEEKIQRFRITDEHLGEGGAKAKYQNNVTAIKLLKQLEDEGRQATPEEQEQLSKYVGWGGIQEAFDDRITSWSAEYHELKNLLTESEYEAARSSTMNAFYTSPVIIEAMYNALDNMGFKGGDILEPSMGVGNFFGMLPDNMQKNSNLTGVELDDISGRIARQLYPEASVAINGFEKMKFENNQFDLAIGNVPFGDITLHDTTKAYKNLKIHDYFFAKSIDKVRSGGVVAFVTSSGTMDKQNNAVRKMIAQKCDLLGAIRLPNTAFKKNAGTEVTSDIIFLQKREKPLKESELSECDWINIGKSENGLPVNQYFADNPQMVLGTLEKSSFRDTIICKALPDSDLKSQLAEAIKNIKGTYEEPEFQPELNEKSSDILTATPDIPNYTYTLVDEKLYFRHDDNLIPLKDSEQSGIKFERRKGMCEIADTVKALLNAQVENRPDDEIEKLQQKLNTQYDKYVAKYGHFNKIDNKNPNSLFKNDVRFPLLQSLEIIEGEKFIGKASIFTERTITPHKAVEHTDTSSEALIVSMSEKAEVDLDYMSELTGFDTDKIISELKGVIYPVPEYSYGDKIEYQTAEEYLSGNIYEKLETAKMAAESNPIFKDNIAALEQAMPEPLTAGEITVKLGATWLDPKIIEQFMYETFNTPQYLKQYENVSYQKNSQAISVEYSDVGKGEWRIANKNSDRTNITVNNTFGTSEMNAYHLLENILNQRTSPKIYDEIKQDDGSKKKVVNRKETEALQLKTQLIKNAFSEWIFKDPERREQLVNQYNEQFNCIKPREYDGSHLKFSGINPEIQLREHQVNAIAHALFGGNTLFAHEVGAGKTFEMIATAMEGKRLGLHNKSMFVVPNHLTEQIATDFMKLYPNANILVAKPEDFSSHNRKKMCSKIATGNFDAVIIGHSQLIKIPVSPEREKAFINDQINEITEALEAAKEREGERFTVKQLEKTKKNLEEKLNRLLNSTTKDSTVTFEELGVDKLFVDEAHLFKNLYISTKMSNVAGITTNDNVQKTQDLFMKCQYLDEVTGNRGITFATGTPVSNSMTEIYSMMKYLQSDELNKHGISNFDSWAANFGETVTAAELAPEGNKYRQRTRFAKFVNIPELMNMFKQCADIKTADVLNLKVPECTKKNICVEPTPMQQRLVKSLSKRAENVQNGSIDPSIDNMLTITNDGRKIGLDPRLIDPSMPDDPNSKLNKCVNNVFQIWEETKPEKSAQLIFCDLGVPQSKEDVKKNGERFSVYDDIKQKLIAKGVPENEIAFIHDAGNNEVKKAQMFAKVRSGEIRVLIGSTSKMGAGTNVQTKLIASHDLDCPWKPADMTQRAGRMIRQGNENKHVKLFRYVTENTFDAYLFQTLEKKQSFISQIMTSKSPARVCDDVDEQALDYAEIKALCAGDPRIKERMQLDIDVSKLSLQKASYMSQKYELEDNVLKRLPQKIATAKNAIKGIQTDIKKASEYTAPVDMDGQEQFTVKLGGSVYTDKTEANTALLELCTKAVSKNPDKETVIGEYKDFPIAVSFDTFDKCFKAHIKGEMTYTTDISSSQQARNFAKLDNLLNSLPTRLATVQNELEREEANLENGKQQLGKPFEYEAELQEKSARLIVLINELEESPTPTVNEEEQAVSEQEQAEKSVTSEITSDSENTEIQDDSSEQEHTTEQAEIADNKTETADINAASDITSVQTNTEEHTENKSENTEKSETDNTNIQKNGTTPETPSDNTAKPEKKQEQSEEKKDEVRQNATPDVKSEETKKSRFCLKDLHSERYAPRSRKDGQQKNEQITK